MRVSPWKSSKWQPPPPEERLTTDQLVDRKVAKKYNKEEESAASRKQGEVPGHAHAENPADDAGAGPSNA
jgi:SP family sugar:H+ symporter-like MFS transporter